MKIFLDFRIVQIILEVISSDGVVKGGSERMPPALGDEDGIAVTPVDLGDGHVAALGVGLHVEVEVLVLDPHLFGILPAASPTSALTPALSSALSSAAEAFTSGSALVIRVFSAVVNAVIVLVNELSEVLREFLHGLGRDEHLGPEVPAAEGLGDLEEPAPGVLLEVHVILLLVLVHHVGQELALPQVVGVDTLKLVVGCDKLIQLAVKQLNGGESHQDLVLPALS